MNIIEYYTSSVPGLNEYFQRYALKIEKGKRRCYFNKMCYVLMIEKYLFRTFKGQ